MDVQHIIDNASSTDVISLLLKLIVGALTVVFLMAFASLIYHWHYYGIGFFRRWTLIAVFGGVGLALILAAYGLMFNLL